MSTFKEYNDAQPWPATAIDHNPFYKRELKLIQNALFQKNWNTALDLGCGYARASLALENSARKWIGMDGAIKMLQYARENRTKSELINAEINFSWPFQDKVFDLVVGLQILNHSSSLHLFFIELRRVMQPGGKAYLSFGNSRSFISWKQGGATIEKDGFQRYPADAVSKSAEKAGFSVLLLGGSGLFSPLQKLFFLEYINCNSWTALRSHLLVMELTN